MRFGPAGKVRRLVHGVQQKERPALAAVGKLTQCARGRAHLVCLEQQNRACEQVPGGVLERVGAHLLLELVGQGKKAVLVFQTGEREQHGAGGTGGVALCFKSAAGIIGGCTVTSARHAQL